MPPLPKRSLRHRAEKPWAKLLLNAVLRRARREADTLLPTLRKTLWYSAPIRAGSKVVKAYSPEDWLAICEANNSHPPLLCG